MCYRVRKKWRHGKNKQSHMNTTHGFSQALGRRRTQLCPVELLESWPTETSPVKSFTSLLLPLKSQWGEGWWVRKRKNKNILVPLWHKSPNLKQILALPSSRWGKNAGRNLMIAIDWMAGSVPPSPWIIAYFSILWSLASKVSSYMKYNSTFCRFELINCLIQWDINRHGPGWC